MGATRSGRRRVQHASKSNHPTTKRIMTATTYEIIRDLQRQVFNLKIALHNEALRNERLETQIARDNWERHGCPKLDLVDAK